MLDLLLHIMLYPKRHGLISLAQLINSPENLSIRLWTGQELAVNPLFPECAALMTSALKNKQKLVCLISVMPQLPMAIVCKIPGILRSIIVCLVPTEQMRNGKQDNVI